MQISWPGEQMNCFTCANLREDGAVRLILADLTVSTTCCGMQGSARVIRCLQDARQKLKKDCQAALFDHEILMSESIEYNAPMRNACGDEISRFCDHIPAGDARVIWCLQQHKEDSHFGGGCKEVCSARCQGVPLIAKHPGLLVDGNVRVCKRPVCMMCRK